MFGYAAGGAVRRIQYAVDAPRARARADPLRGLRARRSRPRTCRGPTAAEERGERLDAILEHWGEGINAALLAPSAAGDAGLRAWFARLERMSASPGQMRTLSSGWARSDVRALLADAPRPDAGPAPRRRPAHRPRATRATSPSGSPARSSSSCRARTTSRSSATSRPSRARSRSSSPAGAAQRARPRAAHRAVHRHLRRHGARGGAGRRALARPARRARRRGAPRARRASAAGRSRRSATASSRCSTGRRARRCAARRAIVEAPRGSASTCAPGCTPASARSSATTSAAWPCTSPRASARWRGPREVLASGTTFGTVVGSGLASRTLGSHELRAFPAAWPSFAPSG